MKTNSLISTALWLIVATTVSVIFYSVGRHQQKAYDTIAELGFHVSARYKLSTGDVAGVNKDNKTAILFLTLTADDMLKNSLINRSSKQSLESMLLRTAHLERDYPLLSDGLAKYWDKGRISYSNALKRVENSKSNRR